jgi:Ca-activated chloride channel family protein
MANHCYRILLALIAGPFVFGSPAHSARAARQVFKRPAIQVNVDLTLVDVTVSDRDGRNISGLTPENFRLWEDKIEQKVEYVSAEDIPATIGLVFDVSSSMDEKSSLARQAVSVFLRAGNRDDEYFLVEFNALPRLVEDFTTDIDVLEQNVFSTKPRGSTALFDAVLFALDRVRDAHRTKKALLLITDGHDNTSRHSLTDTVEYLKEQDVEIFAIGTFADRYSPPKLLHRSGAETLTELTKTTGGQVFFARSWELPKICKTIAEEIRSEYVIGYRSTNPATDGRWRNIRITVNTPGLVSHAVVRAKTGYFAPHR